jgi:hypothetical protein
VFCIRTGLSASSAPINQFVHYRECPDASNKAIVGLNVDTLYSFASLDLAKEPMVLSIQLMGDRFWLMQIIDAWNNVPAAPGSRTVGGKGGNFAIVGPGWKGMLPANLTELRMPTNLVMIGGRTYTAGKDDYAAVHALQDQYKLVPLSAWGKAYTPPDNVPFNGVLSPQLVQVIYRTRKRAFKSRGRRIAKRAHRCGTAAPRSAPTPAAHHPGKTVFLPRRPRGRRSFEVCRQDPRGVRPECRLKSLCYWFRRWKRLSRFASWLASP